MHPFFPLYNLIAIDIGIDTAAKLTGTLYYGTPTTLDNINSDVEILSLVLYLGLIYIYDQSIFNTSSRYIFAIQHDY